MEVPAMTRQYVDVKNLPSVVQDALKSVGYGRTNIEVRASATVVLSTAGGNGSRNFVTLVNLTAGQYKTSVGSWGGSNMFTQTAADDDDNSYALPADGVAVRGSHGGGRPVYAVLYVPASMVDRMLPAPTETLSTAEMNALYAHGAIRGGQYRKDELSRLRVPADAIASIEAKGLIKRNKAGAASITTDGRNALGDFRPSYNW